jgi:quinol monooxygenase YgiN
MPGPILIVGHMRIPAANVAKFREIAGALVTATRQETGCLGYAFSEDVTEPGYFHIAERWADEAAINAHNQTAHLAAFMGALPALGPSDLRLARHQSTGEHLLFGSSRPCGSRAPGRFNRLHPDSRHG